MKKEATVRSLRVTCRYAGLLLPVVVIVGCTGSGTANVSSASATASQATPDQVLRGRQLVIEHACGDCHGGGSNPNADGWLAGYRDSTQEFQIGPFKTRPRNLTPDNTTGLGRFSERQIFNAVRYGLRPGETPDVVITSIAELSACTMFIAVIV